MKISVKMKSNRVIKARLGIQPSGPAHMFFTSTCYKKMAQFVPGGTKSHINQIVNIEANRITYMSPDSHYLYTGKLYVDPKYKKGAFYSPSYGYWSRPGITKKATNENLKYRVPGTGSHWDKKMWHSKKKELISELQAYVDRGCK